MDARSVSTIVDAGSVAVDAAVGIEKKVAVVGLGCYYPGAKSPAELWQNILARRQQFRPMPDGRLPLADYYDADRRTPDKTYGHRAAVLDGYAFDWAARRIPKSTTEATDIAHWLALDTALQMLDDAGYDATRLPRHTTQVIVGNTLTGEFTRSNTMRLRWPYVLKCLRASAAAAGLSGDALQALEQSMELSFKSPFAPVNEDTLAGGLANTIAGRICNYLNVNGGGYTVDGACCSSLIAVYTGAMSLVAGHSDFVIAGGVDISLDPFELIGFAKTGALTSTEMRVYDARGDGFIPGEGCGFVGLKRLADAQRDGDKIYAVMDGWGMSSDGRGGITAPSVEGQHLAIARAYQQARVQPDVLDFIEGHGTGTTLGDKTELLAIAKTLGLAAKPQQCGVTSFKSIVGHTKAAAGIGAFIKGVMAVNQRVLPPTAGCEQAHSVFAGEGRAIYPLIRGEKRSPQARLRGGVSAMGFGGINVHVTLTSPDEAPMPSLQGGFDERASMASWQAAEVFPFAAETPAQLRELITQTRRDAKGINTAELADLAADLASRISTSGHHRAAIVAETPDQLREKLDALLVMLQDAPVPGHARMDQPRGIAMGSGLSVPRLGFLFPGQGSQQLGMARMLIERYEWARELAQHAEQWAAEVGTPSLLPSVFPNLDRMPHSGDREPSILALRQTEIAQPAIALASLLWLQFVERLGLKPDCVLGHSLGELTAFHAAGAFGARELIQLATLRGQQMAARGEPAGAMLSLACTQVRARALLEEASHAGYAVLANINSEEQMIISGEFGAIEAIAQLAESAGVRIHRLPVSNAFHSALVADAAGYLLEHAPIPAVCEALRCTLLSSVDGRRVDAAKDLHRHFSEQILLPVDFVAAAKAMTQEADLLIEVGPGRVLTQLIGNMPADYRMSSFPLEAKAESTHDLNWLLACVHTLGVAIEWKMLYATRVIKPFVPAAQRSFIVNPCERPIAQAEPAALQMTAATPAHRLSGSPESYVDEALERLLGYLKHRGEFVADVIKADVRATARSEGGHVNRLEPAKALIAPATREPIALAAKPVSAPLPRMAPQGARETVLDLVAQFTGFARSSLSLAMTMGDDLNLDSIKATEIVSLVAQRFHLQAHIDPADFTQRSLADLVTAVDTFTADTAAAVVSSRPAATETAQLSAAAMLKQLVARATGFAESSIELSMKLGDDLNMDSIKAGDLIAQAATALGLAGGQLDAAELSAASLGDIAERMEALAPARSHPIMASHPRDAAAVLFDAVARLTGFERDRLSADMRMIDDLNLDSIKVGAVLAEVIDLVGLSGKLDPAELAGETLGAIANRLAALRGMNELPPANQASPSPIAPATDPALPDWVRAYELVLVQDADEVALHATSFAGARCFLQAPDSDDNSAMLIADALSLEGAQITADQTIAGDAKLEHFIAVLPRTTSLEAVPSSKVVASLIEPLHQAAQNALRFGCKTLTFVQFGLAETLRAPSMQRTSEQAATEQAAALDTSCAQAFAASVHLEHPELKVRVLDFSATAANELIAQKIIRELGHDAAYRFSLYHQDGQRERVVPRMLETALLKPRELSWSGEDVVLITGGGKGITAELALAFAKRTGARVALVGRTALDPVDAASSEVRATLQRFNAEHLVAEYFSCDIAEPAAVTALIGQVSQRLGPVTALIHGAGTNKPRRVEQVTSAQALQEISPKLCGMLALCEALDAQPLKLVVGLGSIIGVTGMPGNAWYAFSNQAMDVALANFRLRHPSTTTLTLAYSVWAEVGMGARMGSAKRLAQQGISAIPPDAGVSTFLDLIDGHSPAQQVVVAGRLGGLDTWQPDRSALARPGRFVETVVAYQPGVELVTRVHLSVQSDPYLKDHYYRGVYLFPTVFGLEAMAQQAFLLSGDTLTGDRPRLSFSAEQVRLERPIVVDGNKGTTIELRATVRARRDAAEPLRVDVGIYTEQTGYRRDHFAATMVCAELSPAHDSALPLPAAPIEQLDPLVDLYGGLLFQGTAFQRMRAVHEMSRAGSLTSIERSNDTDYFNSTGSADRLSPYLFAGDPFFRDGLLQTAQLSEQGQFLPVGIESVEVYDMAQSTSAQVFAQNLSVQNRITSRHGDELVCDVTAYAGDGRIIERLRGYRLKRVSMDPTAATPEDWVDPSRRDQQLLEAALDKACATLGLNQPNFVLAHAPQLAQMERTRRRLSELPLFSDVVERALSIEGRALDGDIEIRWDSTGKPTLAGGAKQPLGISLSHDRSHCLCVCGVDPQGCDIEAVEPRSIEAWQALLTPQRAPLLQQLQQSGDTRDEAGTRIWCAVEAAKKALGLGGSIELSVTRREGHAVTFAAHQGDAHASLTLLTLPITLTRPRPKMLAFAVSAMTTKRIGPASTSDTRTMDGTSLTKAALAEAAVTSKGAIGLYDLRGPHGETTTCWRFRVPFKEITTRRHGLNYSVVADWMGNIRELSIVRIAAELVPDFSSGRWGMVTNRSDITIVGNVNCLDLVEGRLWISKVYGALDSSVDMHFDWVRIDPDGHESRIAYSNMTTTWVAIKGHGVVELAPFPKYLQDFTKAYLPTSALSEDPFQARRPIPGRAGAPTSPRIAMEGRALYVAPAAPKIEPILHSHVFDTSLAESNLVGNIYFANYYRWQSTIIDQYLFGLAPKYFRDAQVSGELHCHQSTIQHLREAMPFDEIEVVMALKELYANGFKLQFDYFHVSPSRQRTKLAVGHADCCWVSGSAEGAVRAAGLPEEILQGLLRACGSAEARRKDVLV
ncbi:type I polyketide synthase [Dyella subtropica]|uniref:type I polyketide synthase n=1 Tax=Dyella subtropica TaxID=2992127 RepID=UPI0022553964|nr:type I polyketide synthase [Dyella subtropica]